MPLMERCHIPDNIKRNIIRYIIHLMTSERKYFVGGLGEC